jgi:hypothetical protein
MSQRVGAAEGRRVHANAIRDDVGHWLAQRPVVKSGRWCGKHPVPALSPCGLSH